MTNVTLNEISEQTGVCKATIFTALSRAGVQPSGYKMGNSKRAVFTYNQDEISELSCITPKTRRKPDGALKRPRVNRGTQGTTRGRPKK